MWKFQKVMNIVSICLGDVLPAWMVLMLLKNVYNPLSKEEAIKNGSEYVDKLSNLFGFENQVQFYLLS